MERVIKITLIFSIFVLLFFGFFHQINSITQDLGRHLITGKIIIQTLHVPKINLFSYTYPNFPFINTHWLSEVIFYAIFQASGFNGLLILSTITVIVAFSLVFFFSLKQFNNLTILTIVSFLYINILFERTEIRPEIFSFLFLSIFITILYKYREKATRLIFILPLIELLWVNTHIYFFIGIAVLVFFTIDILIKNRNKLYCRYIGILAVIFLSSALVTLINPNGLKGALYPFNVFQNYGYAIEENQNVFFLWNYFHKPTIIYFVFAVIILFSTLFINIKKTHLIDWLISIFFALLGIFAIRNFPLFVFAALIPFSRNLSSITSRFRFSQVKTHKKIIFLVFITVIILQTILVSSLKKTGAGLEIGAENAVDFFLSKNIKGPVFNNFDIGSYLDYRFYPSKKVFIDGRPEAYPASFFQNVYVPMQEDINKFNEMDKKYNFNSIFFAHTDQTPWAETFIKNINQDQNWKIVYLDDYVVIFLKNVSSNEKIIKTFKPFNFQRNNDINSLLRLASFFQKAGLKNEEKIVYQKILNINSEFCGALLNLSIILRDENNPASSIYLNKFQQRCQ